MVNTKVMLSMVKPDLRQLYAKQGDTGRVLEIELEDYPTENGTLRILRPDGVEKTSDAQSSVSPTITDGMATFDALEEAEVTDLKIALSPKQDLHGLPNPYPDGGYINKFDLAKYFTEGESVTTNDVTATYSNGYLRVTGTNSTSTAFNIVNKSISGTLGAGAYGWKGGGHMFVRASVDGGSNTNYQYTITATTSASLVSFFVVVGANASTDWTIPLQITQSDAIAETYYPYSNICPITGHTEVNTSVVGKNLFPLTLYSGASYNVNVGTTFTFTEASETLVDKGNGVYEVTLASTWKNVSLLSALPSGVTNFRVTATLSSGGQQGFSTYYLDENFTVIDKQIGNSNPVNISTAINIDTHPTCKYVALSITNRGTANATLTLTKPQLEIGTRGTDYEPYNGTTYPLSLGQTVYGGTLDVVSGKLTIDRALVTLDGTQDLTQNGTMAYGGLNVKFVPNPTKKNGTTLNEGLMSDVFNTLSTNHLNPYYFEGRTTNGNLFFNMPSDVTTMPLAKTWFSNNPVQVSYLLATPIEYDLTPQQIQTLLGENNVWADGQITELTFDYGKLLSVLTADQTAVVGKCLLDVDFNGASTENVCYLNILENNKEVVSS